MHHESLKNWQHDHGFGLEKPQSGEKRTLAVVIITLVTMVLEIAAGIMYGSMALMADGIHMASHAVALGVSFIAYIYIRKHANDDRFSFGSGKINPLAGYTSAILLLVVAGYMGIESIERFFNPVQIRFNQAIMVAFIGLFVNIVSFLILGGHHAQNHDSHHHHHDLNLRAAYFHVAADALTSILAILALVTAKLWNVTWVDPLIGVVGAVIVSNWAWHLLKETCHVLLDRQAPVSVRDAIYHSIESQGDNRISDLHVWLIGTNRYAGEIVIISGNPQPPEYYRTLLPQNLNLVHVACEVHHCRDLKDSLQQATDQIYA